MQNWIEDWDITRDIPWGVPVPGSNSENKVFYGWFDNHLAYISTAVKLLESKGYDGAEFWNSSDIYHFIGKDPHVAPSTVFFLCERPACLNHMRIPREDVCSRALLGDVLQC